MKKIILIRHGEASFDSSSDFERGLTENGENQSIVLGAELASLYGTDLLDLFIFSGAKRTAQTVHLIRGSKFDDLPLQKEESLYEAPLQSYLEVIDALSDHFRHVVIVGHNPTLTLLTEYLCGTQTPFSPATCVSLMAEIDSWEMVSRNIFSITNMIHPKMF